MIVKAKEYGQYKGRMCETGTIFEIDDSEIAPWMEKVDVPRPVTPPEKAIEPTPEIPLDKRSEVRDEGEADQHKAEELGLVK